MARSGWSLRNPAPRAILLTVNDDLLTTAQVAERLGKSVATINRMALDDRLTPALVAPGRKGARWYRKADVDALEATA